MSRLEISPDILIDPVLLDFSRTCRLCLQQSTELSPLFPESEPTDAEVSSLPTKIMACVSIKVLPEHNTMPKQVCSKCIQQIDNWVKFKELCESANTLLLQCLDNLQAKNDDANNEVTEKEDKKEENSKEIDQNYEGIASEICCPIKIFVKQELIENLVDDEIIGENSYFTAIEEGMGSDDKMNISDDEMEEKDVNRLPTNNDDDDDENYDFDDDEKKEEKIQVVCSVKYAENRNETTITDNNEEQDAVTENNSNDDNEENPSKWKKRYDRYQKKKYFCGINSCDRFFSRFCDLLKHDRLDHNDLPMDKACEICGKMFVVEDRISFHLSTYHSEKKVTCNICGSKFISKASLTSHLKKHSGRWVCSICGLSTASNVALQEHLRKHSGEKPFVCDTCGQSYVTKTSLNLHKRGHAKELLFKCNICDYKATNYSSMHMHKVTHNLKKDCICETCGKMFKLPGRLQEHRKTHNPDRKHVCDICNKAFLSKYRLTVHLRVHSGERPYECEICSKQFARRDALREHVRTHTGEQKYLCNNCGKTFSFLKALKNHKCPGPNSSTDNSDKVTLCVENDNIVRTTEKLPKVTSTDTLNDSLGASVSVNECLFESN